MKNEKDSFDNNRANEHHNAGVNHAYVSVQVQPPKVFHLDQRGFK